MKETYDKLAGLRKVAVAPTPLTLTDMNNKLSGLAKYAADQDANANSYFEHFTNDLLVRSPFWRGLSDKLVKQEIARSQPQLIAKTDALLAKQNREGTWANRAPLRNDLPIRHGKPVPYGSIPSNSKIYNRAVDLTDAYNRFAPNKSLAPMELSSRNALRVGPHSSALNFTQNSQTPTMSHEIGHNHQLNQAPYTNFAKTPKLVREDDAWDKAYTINNLTHPESAANDTDFREHRTDALSTYFHTFTKDHLDDQYNGGFNVSNVPLAGSVTRPIYDQFFPWANNRDHFYNTMKGQNTLPRAENNQYQIPAGLRQRSTPASWNNDISSRLSNDVGLPAAHRQLHQNNLFNFFSSKPGQNQPPNYSNFTSSFWQKPINITNSQPPTVAHPVSKQPNSFHLNNLQNANNAAVSKLNKLSN